MTISFNGSVGSCNNSGIKKLQINSAGDLICTYADNTIENLGHVVGLNGKNGSDFNPDERGFEIPDGSFRQDKPFGWSYLSLANGKSILYIKTSDENVDPSTWNTVEIGRGEKGDQGRAFQIDSQGTVLPTTNLHDEYTFLNLTDGRIYIYDEQTTSWTDYPWVGKQGERGFFKIDEQGTDLPDVDDKTPGYTFYDTDTGQISYVVEDDTVTPAQKSWSQPIQFRGPDGKSIKGDKGDTGEKGDGIHLIYNEINHEYTNTLLVVGTCPAGYVVTNIQVDINEAYSGFVNDMHVRFGGTVQSETDGIVIAPGDYFDLQMPNRYIVNEVNHMPSDKEEILSCIFNESVNNSAVGKMTIRIELAHQLPIMPISENI